MPRSRCFLRLKFSYEFLRTAFDMRRSGSHIQRTTEVAVPASNPLECLA
jgi:hypothetical protein